MWIFQSVSFFHSFHPKSQFLMDPVCKYHYRNPLLLAYECILQFSWNYQNLQFLNTNQKLLHISNYPAVNVHRCHMSQWIRNCYSQMTHAQTPPTLMVYFMMPVSQTTQQQSLVNNKMEVTVFQRKHSWRYYPKFSSVDYDKPCKPHNSWWPGPECKQMRSIYKPGTLHK